MRGTAAVPTIAIEETEDEKKEKPNEIYSDSKKVGRNEKCPCGSGKKFKHCCGLV